jgi:hypothetical protein
MDMIEIRDPTINQEEILSRITTQVKGKTVPDFSTIGPESLQNPQAGGLPESDSKSGNHETFIDLMLLHQLQEPEFTSEAPLIGPWIVRLRQLWNWMSTKWYVRPIIKQQSTINGQIALLLVEMETTINENKRTIANLEAKVKRLESSLTPNNLPEQ